MYKALKELSFGTLCGLYVFGFSMLGAQFVFSKPVSTADAQMSGGSGGMGGGGGGSSSGGGSGNTSTQYTATLIGGTTGGINDDEVCCNGIVLDFESNFPGNPLILDGYALFVPGLSKGWETDNHHFDEGYNTLGSVRQGLCFTPESECYSVETILEVVHVGTSPDKPGSTGGGSAGGVGNGGGSVGSGGAGGASF